MAGQRAQTLLRELLGELGVSGSLVSLGENSASISLDIHIGNGTSNDWAALFKPGDGRFSILLPT